METDGMSQKEKSTYFRNKVSGTIRAFGSRSKYAEHDWSVGAFPNTVVKDVCRYSTTIYYVLLYY